MTNEKELSYEKQIRELKQINKNQQELIIDYEKQLKIINDSNYEKLEENTYTLLFVNCRVEYRENENLNKENILETIKIPCWNEKPVEFAKIFQHTYYAYEYLYHSSWFTVSKIIILSKTYKYNDYETEYLNQIYLNEEITYDYLIEKYEEIKNKYKLTGMII